MKEPRGAEPQPTKQPGNKPCVVAPPPPDPRVGCHCGRQGGGAALSRCHPCTYPHRHLRPAFPTAALSLGGMPCDSPRTRTLRRSASCCHRLCATSLYFFPRGCCEPVSHRVQMSLRGFLPRLLPAWGEAAELLTCGPCTVPTTLWRLLFQHQPVG